MKHQSHTLTTPARLLILAMLAASASLFAWTPGDIAAVGPGTSEINLSAYASVLYVAPAGDAETADGSKTKPYPSVAGAVNRAQPAAGARAAVLVAAGTYDDATVIMREGVDLFGGFEPVSWKRDIFANTSILDGLKARRVVLGASNARLDGFVIRRGRAQGHGGGILCDGTSPTITNNIIEDCHTVAPEDFRSDRIHQEGHRGGGIACLFESVPVIANNIFRNNHTEIGDGGGIAFYGWHRLPGKPRGRIENNVIVGNVSGTKDFDRTRSSSGGGIVFSHEAMHDFRNNVVAHNRAMGRSDAGGIYNEFYSSPVIENNWVVGNEGDDDGGGLYTMREGDPLIRHNLFAGNWTTMGGVGGVRVSKEGRARVIDNQIVRNQSGGGLYLVDGFLVATGNLIADNLKGSGIRVQQHFDYFQPSRIENNRILNNAEGGISVPKGDGTAPALTGNQIQDGPPDTSSVEWRITRATFDRRTGRTTILVVAPTGADGALAGRTVWRGNRWSVVVANHSDSITVWGDLSDPDSGNALNLLPEYPES